MVASKHVNEVFKYLRASVLKTASCPDTNADHSARDSLFLYFFWTWADGLAHKTLFLYVIHTCANGIAHETHCKGPIQTSANDLAEEASCLNKGTYFEHRIGQLKTLAISNPKNGRKWDFKHLWRIFVQTILTVGNRKIGKMSG